MRVAVAKEHQQFVVVVTVAIVRVLLLVLLVERSTEYREL